MHEEKQRRATMARPRSARGPHRSRADVPPALLDLAGCCRSRCCSSAQRSRTGWAIPPPPFRAASGSRPVFAVIVFLYGGLPFLQMAVPELRNRKPGMMTLISLAIIVAFVYSLAALFIAGPDQLFLGAGDPDRHHAPGPLDRDAQRAPGIGRAERAGQADARHRRAHSARRRAPRRCPSTELQAGRPGAGPARRQRPGRRRGGGGRVGRQRGHDHRRVQAGAQRAGRQGHRRDHQRRRQPARAGDGHRRRDGPGRHHAPGG